MKTISRYNVYSNTWDSVVLFDSAMLAKLYQLDPEHDKKTCVDLIEINAKIPEPRENETPEQTIRRIEALERLDNLLEHGIQHNGRLFKPFCSSSALQKDAGFVCLNEVFIEPMGKWLMCGLPVANHMKIAINKLLVYMGLTMSATKKFKTSFGKAIDITRVVVVPDGFVSVDTDADFCNGVTVERRSRVVEINAFDGAAIIDPALTRGEACTLRTSAAGWKICAFPVDFRAFARERGVSTIKDRWGKIHSVDDVDLIVTESCFKFASQCKDWEAYQQAFIQYKHEFRVCVREHEPRLKALSYQALQTLVAGTVEDADYLVEHAYSTVAKYEDPDVACNLLGGLGRQATDVARYLPSIMTHDYHRAIMEAGWRKRRDSMIGGRVPASGYNAFIAPDMVAMLEHVFGMPIVGVLRKGECSCRTIRSGIVDVIRYPHLDHAHVLLNNRQRVSRYMSGPTMFVNIFDELTLRLRADYDGDHVWYTTSPRIIDIVRRTNLLLDNRLVDWDAPKAPKEIVSHAGIIRFLRHNTAGSQIGIYADNMTRFWNNLDTESLLEDDNAKQARFLWSWLTWAGNVLIDAAKHGSVNVRQPKAVRDLRENPLPELARWAKANTEHPVNSSYFDERCAQTGSFADTYSLKIRERIPEQIPVRDLDNLVFNHKDLQIEPGRPTGKLIKAGLWADGTYNRATKTRDNQGLFQRIANRHKAEWEALGFDGDTTRQMSWDEWVGQMARDEIQRFAEANGGTLEEAYDVIVGMLFTMKKHPSDSKDGHRNILFRCFWRTFGDMALSTVSARFEKEMEDTAGRLDIADDRFNDMDLDIPDPCVDPFGDLSDEIENGDE